VVPYNPFLLRRFRSHINVEVCTHLKMVKYLFKHVHKGPDHGTALMKGPVKDNNDEIKQYLDARSISVAEATWCIFEFSPYKRFPSVECLRYHLPNEQEIYFYENGSVEQLVHLKEVQKQCLLNGL